MNFTTQAGTATRVVTSGLSTITSANAALIGILFNGTATGSAIIFHGVTASASVAYVRAYSTAVGVTNLRALYYPLPAMCSGGITIDIGSTTDPDVTLFWTPAGG